MTKREKTMNLKKEWTDSVDTMFKNRNLHPDQHNTVIIDTFYTTFLKDGFWEHMDYGDGFEMIDILCDNENLPEIPTENVRTTNVIYYGGNAHSTMLHSVLKQLFISGIMEIPGCNMWESSEEVNKKLSVKKIKKTIDSGSYSYNTSYIVKNYHEILSSFFE